MAMGGGLLVACALVLASILQAADQAVVVLVTRGCSSRYVASAAGGFIILEWFGGYSPSKGDRLIGELNSYGFKDIYVANADAFTRAWIDDYFLSQDRVVEKLLDKGCTW